MKTITRTTNTSYHELKKKNDESRIWLEGEPLVRAGFKPGGFYETTLNIDTLEATLRFVPDSPEARVRWKNKELRKVSRRQMSGWVKPIIDICNASITQIFGDFGRFKAQAFSNGTVIFSVHHEELARVERENRFKDSLMRGVISKGDAFLGFGISSSGLKDGFAQSGLKTKQVWAIEMESRYLDIACKNSPDVYRDAHLFAGKVEEIETQLLDKVDAFSFSMPCTNHSLSGRAKKQISQAELGEEATALFGVTSIIKAVNPAIIFSENVTMAKGSASYLLLLAELKRMGYEYKEMVLDKTHSGSLERRQRYWFVAYSKGLALGDINVPETAPIHNSFGDIMETEEEYKGDWHDIENLTRREKLNIENGRNFRMNFIDKDSKEINTLTRHITKHQLSTPVILNSDKSLYRLPTVAEHAAIKRIPQRLVKHASATVAHEGMGQSIVYHHAVGLAYATAIKAINKLSTQPSLELV
jgi:DNA (cytosine-5)-methyltransferase 1